MKVTYNWLKEFVEMKIPAAALADKLTQAGLEVTSLEKQGSDFVFEIEVTSNRPDWLSVIGIAREVAAITDRKLQLPPDNRRPLRLRPRPGFKAQGRGHSLILKIADRRDCPLYTAKIIEGLKVGPSPGWLQERLGLIGCRSINNVADITNYILFTWGQPLHAFDLDKLSPGAIIVRRARKGEAITTIDGQERLLNPQILVISDKKRPLAVAGVMGGRETEVTAETKNILLEAAVFNPVLVRRARQGLALQSESAYRFERGVDIQALERASWEAVAVIRQACGGNCTGDEKSARTENKKYRIHLHAQAASRTLGVHVAPAKIKKILKGLAFQVSPAPQGSFMIGVPSFRQDIKSEIDLIEEVARIFGYSHIPATLPQATPSLIRPASGDLVSAIKNILTGLGLSEVITYTLIDKDTLAAQDTTEVPRPIEILNPLSKEQATLRSTLVPSLARCVAYNLNQKQPYVSIFEVAKVFYRSGQGPREELVLAVALCGCRSWFFPEGMVREALGPLHIKGILETLFSRLGIQHYDFKMQPDSRGEVAVRVNKAQIGVILRLQKDILDRLDIKNKEVCLAQISLDTIFPGVALNKKFIPFPKYPGLTRDISFILGEDIAVSLITESLKENGRPLLQDIRLLDYYRGSQIPPGFRGLTLSCFYRSDACTLREEEIAPVHARLCALLTERFGAQMRW